MQCKTAKRCQYWAVIKLSPSMWFKVSPGAHTSWEWLRLLYKLEQLADLWCPRAGNGLAVAHQEGRKTSPRSCSFCSDAAPAEWLLLCMISTVCDLYMEMMLLVLLMGPFQVLWSTKAEGGCCSTQECRKPDFLRANADRLVLLPGFLCSITCLKPLMFCPPSIARQLPMCSCCICHRHGPCVSSWLGGGREHSGGWAQSQLLATTSCRAWGVPYGWELFSITTSTALTWLTGSSPKAGTLLLARLHHLTLAAFFFPWHIYVSVIWHMFLFFIW